MRSHRRALVVMLGAVVLAGTLSSCTRSPWWRPTTTTRRVTTTTRAGGGGGGGGGGGTPVHGRYVDKVFDNITQVATGVTFKKADAAGGYSADLKFDAWAPAGDTTT